MAYFLRRRKVRAEGCGRGGRGRGFTSVLIRMQCQAERDAKARAAGQRRAVVEAERARRAYERAVAADQKVGGSLLDLTWPVLWAGIIPE